MKLTLLRIPLLLAGDGCGVLVACTEVASASVISMSSLLDGETLGIAEHGVIADADTHAAVNLQRWEEPAVGAMPMRARLGLE